MTEILFAEAAEELNQHIDSTTDGCSDCYSYTYKKSSGDYESVDNLVSCHVGENEFYVQKLKEGPYDYMILQVVNPR
jgi:protein-arginine kinase activator protein McsA